MMCTCTCIYLSGLRQWVEVEEANTLDHLALERIRSLGKALQPTNTNHPHLVALACPDYLACPLAPQVPVRFPQGEGMLPPAKGTGLLEVAPGHVGLLGPPPIPPGGPVVPPSQGGMMHPSAPSAQPPPPHMMQAPQSHGSSYIVELTDLSGSLSLEEMTERIRSRGFPQSCDFVLQLLDRYIIFICLC